MEWTLEGRTFTRVRQPLVHVLLTGWTGFMFFGALSGITDDFTDISFLTWGDSAEGVFAVCFVLLWFAIVGGLVLKGLSGLCTVHISRSGVQMKLLGISVRDLDATEVKTVVKVKRQHDSRLVLLTLTAEELRELSRSFSEKRKIRRHDLRMKDHTRTTNEQVKRYVARSLHKNRFWMEWSEDAERELRKNLTTTIFIL